MIEVFYNVKAIVIDGESKPLDEQAKPFLNNGTTYVPLRFIAEALGKDVSRDGATGRLGLSRNIICMV
ncbi:stalk domain-containing protein [Paenibacillus sp. S-38]|uniref:stalk domain-containing protein n=1 Tax=Paenibacillus sp. S-38 TaxID=3416710 RepID=UPI003CFB652C